MSLVKQEVAPSAYIDSVKLTKTSGKAVVNKAYRQAVNNRNTTLTLWLLAMKHKVALLAIGNIILVLNWMLPEWPQMVLGLIGK